MSKHMVIFGVIWDVEKCLSAGDSLVGLRVVTLERGLYFNDSYWYFILLNSSISCSFFGRIFKITIQRGPNNSKCATCIISPYKHSCSIQWVTLSFVETKV